MDSHFGETTTLLSEKVRMCCDTYMYPVSPFSGSLSSFRRKGTMLIRNYHWCNYLYLVFMWVCYIYSFSIYIYIFCSNSMWLKFCMYIFVEPVTGNELQKPNGKLPKCVKTVVTNICSGSNIFIFLFNFNGLWQIT